MVYFFVFKFGALLCVCYALPSVGFFPEKAGVVDPKLPGFLSFLPRFGVIHPLAEKTQNLILFYCVSYFFNLSPGGVPGGGGGKGKNYFFYFLILEVFGIGSGSGASGFDFG